MKRFHGAPLLKVVAIAVGGVAAAALATAWVARRSGISAPGIAAAPAPIATEPSLTIDEAFEPSPDSFTFEAEPASEATFTARPKGHTLGILSHDDYDAFEPEELGAAFLAAATDTALDEPPRSTADVSGFQVFEANGDG